MNKFKWQHIQFSDGSNPYVCMTEENFEYMRNKYDLTYIKDGFWMANVSKKSEDLLWADL